MTEAQAGQCAGQCEPGTNNPIRGGSMYGNPARGLSGGLADLGRPPVPEMIRAQKRSDPVSAVMSLQESLNVLTDRISDLHGEIGELTQKLGPVLSEENPICNQDGMSNASSQLQDRIYNQIRDVQHATTLLRALTGRVNL